MRDKRRIDRILKLLRKIWMKDPDMRFGQLLINVGIVPDDWRLWGMEDNYPETMLKGYSISDHGKTPKPAMTRKQREKKLKELFMIR